MTDFPLHLLRHGAPEREGLLLGRTDAAPTPEGIAACVAQAERLEVKAIVSSDLARCRLAAQAIAHRLALPVRIDRRWRELDFGAWDGLAPSQIDPAALAGFWQDPDAAPPPQGERWSALAVRVGEALADLAAVPTLVVTHGGAMRAALHRLCDFDQRQVWAFDLPYAACLSLRVWPGESGGAQVVGLRS